MKLNRKWKNVLGLAAFLAALSLTVSFVVTAIRKKSLWQAFLALLAAEGAAGAALYLHHTNGKICRNGVENERAEDEVEGVAPSCCDADEELFDEVGSREAAMRIRHIFAAKRDEAAAPSLRPEIPRDEEASEADFQ